MSQNKPEERIDASAGGGLNNAAVQAAGLPGTEDTGEQNLPATDDLGAAVDKDVGAGLGATRGTGRQNPRGQITGVGGARGTGAGSGEVEDTPGRSA